MESAEHQPIAGVWGQRPTGSRGKDSGWGSGSKAP